ncbi:MAG: hypothetical protein V4634_12410 [Pseudomonadota bacterium]
MQDTKPAMQNLVGWTDSTSGDWLTLEEAAQRLTASFPGSLKTGKDILKAGYIDYTGIDHKLNVYVVAKELLILTQPMHAILYEEKLQDWPVLQGTTFRLAPISVEALVLNDRLSSEGVLFGLRTIASTAEIAGWQHQLVGKEKAGYWFADSECVISSHTPTSIVAEDIRIDGAELDDFIEQAKASRDVSSDEADLTQEATAAYAEADGEKAKYPWIDAATRIGREVRDSTPSLTVDKIAEKVHQKMVARHASGATGMAGRGGKVPSAGSIKRHALKGIKN